MDIVIQNLPDQITDIQVRKFFRPYLEKIGISSFHCQKVKRRGCATITLHDNSRGERFLADHGQSRSGPYAFKAVRLKLYFRERPVYCLRGNQPADDFLVESLRSEEREKYTGKSRAVTLIPPKSVLKAARKKTFDSPRLSVGQWAFIERSLTHVIQFIHTRPHRLTFTATSILVKIMPLKVGEPPQQLVMPYDSVQSLVVWSNPPSVTFSLSEAPRIYEETSTSQTQELRDALFKAHQYEYKRKRISTLNDDHRKVVGHCFAYEFALLSHADVRAVEQITRQTRVINSTNWNISQVSRKDFASSLSLLNQTLAEHEARHVPFEILFQCQRLTQNGHLSPRKVIDLLSEFLARLQFKSSSTVASAIRHMSSNIPIPAPGVDSSELKTSSLVKLYQASEDHTFESDPYSLRLAEEYDHIMLVHKAMVTPTTRTLSGPVPEVKNRVLRLYSEFSDFFLFVTFAEENGEMIRFDRNTSSEDIFEGRFKTILEGNINIAGRGFEFLGFSHSSLREQTCWFMAPFVKDGRPLWARSVIQGLGDFGSIRSPAKCAARIGQAFSQTLSAIAISPSAFSQIPDIERNGRTFSDGVGTCSMEVLVKIWDGYNGARLMGLRPTIFQIRFQGAKGVISLDNRLEGEQLRLRPSMIKFSGSPENSIEICGSARKPLPMYLNRQLIKILEDLGVPLAPFMELQRKAVEELRITTRSPINASTFLERNRISTAAYLPWLVKKLHYIGIDFSKDQYLRNTLELSVLTQLREIKHRSRILVHEGWTLFGIMDETGLLREDEIYCAVHGDDGLRTLTGRMVITRSPAVHPGDVQCVTAVDVPENSPLKGLYNMVVFSQQGARDLPSKLSGGDLDGDLYNVIWDPRLYPRMICEPADYATPQPIDIGRHVERGDITDFFLTFMQNDNLGMIAVLHQIIADQKKEGTLDPRCIDLAGMHSTAVDFSKSGIPVDRRKIGVWPKARPDFQAPGPHVLISNTVDLKSTDYEIDEEIYEGSDEDEYAPKKIHYYPSEKVLGQLYRDIDEVKFVEEMKSKLGKVDDDANLIDDVWLHIRQATALIQWEHYKDFARGVKDNYEELMVDTILTHSAHPNHPISELEVFSGSILGARSAQSKRQRETQIQMKDRFERDVRYITSWIRGGEGEDEDGALERSMACLFVGSQEPRARGKFGVLKSFAWVAAAVCLKEVENFTASMAKGVLGDAVVKKRDKVLLGAGLDQDYEGLPVPRTGLVKGKENVPVQAKLSDKWIDEDEEFGGVLVPTLQDLSLNGNAG